MTFEKWWEDNATAIWNETTNYGLNYIQDTHLFALKMLFKSAFEAGVVSEKYSDE